MKKNQMKKMKYLILIILPLLIGCGGSREITNYTPIHADSLYQYSNNQIKKTYNAKPQITLPIKLSYYSSSDELEPIVDPLQKSKIISKIYSIPTSLAEGDNYYERKSHPWYYMYGFPVSTNTSQLRLLAAQGRTDVLLYCGQIIQKDVSLNNLAWADILIIPILFTHSYDMSIKESVDIFIIDVKNNYLYAYQRLEEDYNKNGATIWEIQDSQIEKIKKRLLNKIISKAVNYIENELSDPKNRKHEIGCTIK